MPGILTSPVAAKELTVGVRAAVRAALMSGRTASWEVAPLANRISSMCCDLANSRVKELPPNAAADKVFPNNMPETGINVLGLNHGSN